MVDSQKIRFLNEVVSKSRPQNVDYTPHNGCFCVLLFALQPIDWVSVQQRDFKLTGELKENESLSVTLIIGNEALFSISALPYVAPQGDRTPIFQILRASICCAYGALRLPYLHRNIRKIDGKDFPLAKSDSAQRINSEAGFMKRLAKVSSDAKHHVRARAVLIHPASSRLKNVISYYKEYETGTYNQINASLEALKSFAPDRDNVEGGTPDVFAWDYYSDDPGEVCNLRIAALNAHSKEKERFWWDYLKLNIFLSDSEYEAAYYVLMNRWQVPVIQKWIAEYRDRGYYESQRAQDYLLFYIKASEKAPVRVLNSQGVPVKIKMIPR